MAHSESHYKASACMHSEQNKRRYPRCVLHQFMLIGISYFSVCIGNYLQSRKKNYVDGRGLRRHSRHCSGNEEMRFRDVDRTT